MESVKIYNSYDDLRAQINVHTVELYSPTLSSLMEHIFGRRYDINNIVVSKEYLIHWYYQSASEYNKPICKDTIYRIGLYGESSIYIRV